MTLTQLEHRVATLEQKLAALAGPAQAQTSPDVNAWIDEIHGTFKDDLTYHQAARLGRKWRKSKRPAPPRARKASSK